MTSWLRALSIIPVFAGLAWGGDDKIQILQFLDSTGADGDATCRARWRQDDDDTDFNIELEDLPQGSYELWVAGVLQESIAVGALGEGEAEFQTPKDGNKPLFDFQVLDQLIEIRQGATTYFSDVFDGSGSSGGGGSGGGGAKARIEILMVNVGPDANAKGKLEHELGSGKVKFKIEVEHLDAGTYQLLVAGAPVAELEVTGAELELEFQDPVEPGKLLLNFDPLGAQVEVARDGVTYLAAVLPGAGGGSSGSAKKQVKDVGKGKGDALLVVLQNSGLIPGAHGTVKLSVSGEVELEVELEDLPDGDYGLSIAGAPVGTISVVAQHGEAKLVSPPAVQGQLVAVTSGADTVLSTIFPVSVPAALDKFKKEVHKPGHVSINLVSTGADLDARGLLTFKSKNSHDSLVVKVEDLAAGSYDLIIGGTTKTGVLVVAKQDGRAKVSFHTAPGGSKLLLDVAVPGELVQVTPVGDPGTVLLAGIVE
jgi:hypothetical protein